MHSNLRKFTNITTSFFRLTVLRKCSSGRVDPISVRRRQMPRTISLLAVLVMYPWLATGAEHSEVENPPEASAEEIITPEQELIEKLEGMESVRIVMHAKEPAKRLADQLELLLTALGADGIEKRIVDDAPDYNQVRYFHPADKEAGQAVGEALSLVFDEVAVRSFEDYQPAPSDGLIEIWLR